MSYSLELAFVRLYSAAAVAVQGVLDACKTAEKLTRPPVRHTGFDEEVCGDFLGEPQQASLVMLESSAEDARREMAAARNRLRHIEQLIEQWFDVTTSAPIITDIKRHVRDFGVGFIPGPVVDEPHLKRPNDPRCPDCPSFASCYLQCTTDGEIPDEVPNPTEPSLSDDELVAVRGLIQERYEDDRRPKWLRDVEVGSREQAYAILRGDPPPCEHRYCARQGYAMCFGVTGAQMDMIEDTRPQTSAPATDPGAVCCCGHWLHPGNICAACFCDESQLKPSAAGGAQ